MRRSGDVRMCHHEDLRTRADQNPRTRSLFYTRQCGSVKFPSGRGSEVVVSKTVYLVYRELFNNSYLVWTGSHLASESRYMSNAAAFRPVAAFYSVR